MKINNNITDKDYCYTTKLERFTNEGNWRIINKIIDDPDKIEKFVNVIDDFLLATNLNLDEVKSLIFKIQTEPGLKKLYMTELEYSEYQDKLYRITG